MLSLLATSVSIILTFGTAAIIDHNKKHTIGDVNFVNEVSSFYMSRNNYKKMLLGELKEEWTGKDVMQSFEQLLDINYPEYVYLNHSWLREMKRQRDMCMQMMKVSEKDLAEFSKQHTKTDNQEEDTIADKVNDEFMSYSTVLEQAREKLKK